MLAVLVALLLVTAACATPIGVYRGDARVMHHELTRSVLSTGTPSAPSEQILRSLGLAARFRDAPAATLAELRGTGAGLSRDRLFALAELSFVHAEQVQATSYYLAAAVYAYAFLFGDPLPPGSTFDPRARLAADLYNLGLSRGLAVTPPEPLRAAFAPREPASGVEAAEVLLTDRELPLPFGQLELRGEPADFLWGEAFRMSRFIAVGEFKIRGLRNRYRQAGIGMPLAAEVTPWGTDPRAEATRRRVAARIKVPVTAFVRLDDVLAGLASGRVTGRLELYPADLATTVQVGDRTLPLELEPSATVAYGLEDSPVWDLELGTFLSAESAARSERLYMAQPYRAGRVPVVLIHGTTSSPARWGEMFNEIWMDPALRNRVQFWFFTYPTSNPILQSAAELRRALREIVEELDPEGRDPALREMVLVGHSQGGLLARLMVTNSGTRFWDNVSRAPFSEIRGSHEALALVQEVMFFTPVTSVRRVVFLATPHRGSFRVSSLLLDLVRRIVTLPVRLATTLDEIARRNPHAGRGTLTGVVPTAVDNMRPGHHFIRTLAASPIAPGVTTHSIIAVLGEGPVIGKTDGVVTYESAHLEGVASERIVRSGHSVQDNPEAILEVQRILREHLGIR